MDLVECMTRLRMNRESLWLQKILGFSLLNPQDAEIKAKIHKKFLYCIFMCVFFIKECIQAVLASKHVH